VIDDISDKQVVHCVLEHRRGEASFLLVQYAWPPTPAAPLSGSRETGFGVFDD
jgi:hypothetical protein